MSSSAPASRPRRGFQPKVDVYYCGDPDDRIARAVVKADLAGVDIDEVALEIRGRQLVIAGERRAQESEGRLYQQIEIEHGPVPARRRARRGRDRRLAPAPPTRTGC